MRAAGVCLLVLLSIVAARAEPVNRAVPAPELVVRVRELMTVLARYDLFPEPVRTNEEVMRTIVQQADPVGGLFTAEEAERWIAWSRGRIYDAGLRVVSTNGRIVIEEVIEGSGADQAAIRVDEEIDTLDKGRISGMKADEVAELLRGNKSETVRLGIRGSDGDIRETNVVLTATSASAVARAEDLPTGIAYVRLNGVYENADREIVSTLRRWVGTEASGLVLDLRGAGGLDAEAASSVASLFTPEGSMLFTFRDIQDQDIAVYKARPAFRVDMPAMVLVDGRTTGAAETLAATLAGSVRGVMLIGDVTRGDPLVREFIELSDGLKLYVATRRLTTADGTVYDGRKGVKPHLIATPDVMPAYEPVLPEALERKMTEEEREDRRLRDRVRGDPVLRRAVDLLQGLRALDIGISRTPETAAY